MRIVIINPNSDQNFTDTIASSAVSVAAPGTEIRCLTTIGAPGFIENYKDEILCAPLMMRLVEEWENKTDAFVIACTCDPNLTLLRELTDKPTLGAGECSMLLASVLGHRFSILQTTAHSVPMKRELVKKYGFSERCASVVAVDENTSASMEDKLYEAGRIAISRDGAEVLALGCAGLAGLDARLRARLDVPVVDGVTASVKIAEAVVSSGNKTSKKGLYASVEA